MLRLGTRCAGDRGQRGRRTLASEMLQAAASPCMAVGRQEGRNPPTQPSRVSGSPAWTTPSERRAATASPIHPSSNPLTQPSHQIGRPTWLALPWDTLNRESTFMAPLVFFGVPTTFTAAAAHVHMNVTPREDPFRPHTFRGWVTTLTSHAPPPAAHAEYGAAVIIQIAPSYPALRPPRCLPRKSTLQPVPCAVAKSKSLPKASRARGSVRSRHVARLTARMAHSLLRYRCEPPERTFLAALEISPHEVSTPRIRRRVPIISNACQGRAAGQQGGSG